MHRVALVFLLTLALVGDVTARQTSSGRVFAPDDMFRVRRVGASAWALDGRNVIIEFSKPSRWLAAVPTNDIAALDVATRTLRIISSRSSEYVGFFGAVWAPDSRRVAFLSVDAAAIVRAWIWSVGSTPPTMIPGIDAQADGDPSLAWVDSTRLAVLAWDEGAEKSGGLSISLLRGRNAADDWKRAMDGRVPTVSVMSSGGKPLPEAPSARLVVVDVESGTQKTLARGRLSRITVAPDGCCVGFLRNVPARVASYFELATRAGDVDAAYLAVTRGTSRDAIDVRTGTTVDPPATSRRSPASPAIPATLPAPDARRIATAPAGDAALYAANGEDGSRVWIAGGGGRPLSSTAEIWRDNEWMRDVRTGRAQSLSYVTPDGKTLTAWLLLPPGHVAGTRVPLITRVYPGTVYDSTTPAAFSPYFAGDFEHAQLFAALGYAVLLPSIPTNPDDPSALEPLMAGVMPAIDAAVSNGIADPKRIAIVGQSGGGFATLGLITQTNRFRSAIASAAYSNLVSLYGTFYGTYRYGDGGRPEIAQVLRMLQLENGFMGLGADPWTAPARYRNNSPLLRADKVETPLMLIKGDLDWVPVQQAEEFFTALLRRDKRAVFLRYAGEVHGIIERQNVLDVWRRMTDWLAETMGPAPSAAAR